MSKFFLSNGVRTLIATEQDLVRVLETLSDLSPESEVELLADSKNWVRAKRIDERWHVERRKGGFWTIHTLTPGDFLRDSQGLFDRKPRGRFESKEVAKIFATFFHDQKIPFPILGA